MTNFRHNLDITNEFKSFDFITPIYLYIYAGTTKPRHNKAIRYSGVLFVNRKLLIWEAYYC